MSISDNDYKILWGRAAGICSNPSCDEDLTVMLNGGGGYNVGEMAHVIARSPGGPRGQADGGADTYDNLILLCPTCHRKIDKAPEGTYPEEMIFRWKAEHEGSIRSAGTALKFTTFTDLKKYVGRLLIENNSVWATFGPRSDIAQTDPGSNLHEVWTLRKLSTIVPNNQCVVNAIESNFDLLPPESVSAFYEFKMHASGFEQHQYRRLDAYPLYPSNFQTYFLS
ncbi:MAG: HNH endonuclease signature motif containing protein [Burkholderiaceae bacterium]|nr:HNH endonuclease signature motif containing protein [Burkholderiaceae bacterium]